MFSNGKEEVKNIEKAGPTSAATKSNDKDKGNDSTHLNLADATCSNGKEKVKNVEKVGPTNATTKGNDSTHLNSVVDTLADAPSVAAPSVEVPHVASPPANGPELVAPTDLSASCAAHVDQPCFQATAQGDKQFGKGDKAQGTSNKHNLFCQLNVIHQLNKRFPRGKHLLPQLILLAPRLPIVRV